MIFADYRSVLIHSLAIHKPKRFDMRASMKLKLQSTLAIFASAIVFSGAASAQKNYQASNDYAGGVTIYEHCDFKGKSQTLRPGEYRSLRDVGFGNDKMSSIRVPRGAEAVIYRDDNFRGSYARISNDIRCFDRQWNDEASSISVRDTGYSNNDRGRNGRNNNASRNDRYNDSTYDGRSYDNRRSANDRKNNYGLNQANVTTKNVAQVVFDGTSLKQTSKNQWSLVGTRGRSQQFQEVRRDRDSVYLENSYTGERVRIDLFASDVTFVSREGRQQRYGIDRKIATLPSSNDPYYDSPVKSSSSSNNRRIRSECFNFKAYARGGNGSVRFLGKKDLYRLNSKITTDRICHNGSLAMEIGKTHPGTEVTVVINGKYFTFKAGEKENNYVNNWYRKTVKLSVGR